MISNKFFSVSISPISISKVKEEERRRREKREEKNVVEEQQIWPRDYNRQLA